MEENRHKSTDLLGIASYGEAIKIVVERGFDGASALLSRICLPAAGELGLMFQDKVRFWRLKNIIHVINKAEGRINFTDNQLQLHPRVAHEIIENATWCDDEVLQDMWAGLLATTCNEDNSADSNIIYTNKLKQITSVQARLINHICNICNVTLHTHNLIMGRNVALKLEDLIKITGVTDIDRLDGEMDELRANELIGTSTFSLGGGFTIGEEELIANLKPSALLLQLFAKTQGHNGLLKDFYADRITPYDPSDPESMIILGGN